MRMKKLMKLGIIIVGVMVMLVIGAKLFIMGRPWIAGGVVSDIGESLYGVSLSIENGSLTREGATFVVHNDSDYRINFCWSSLNIRLQVLRGEEWRNINNFVQTAGCCINSHDIGSGESTTIELNWSGIYGRLSRGRYRFVDRVFVLDEYLEHRDEYGFSVVYEFNVR